MADALQDITTLAGAFGSFTQSLATLHDTKVRVEKSLRSAQIERANNDFLQRFNLAYDDPNRLTSTNWMDALKEHDASIEEFLVQTRGGKAVDAEVRAELMPITEGFTTAVGNKMITAYREETQATQLKVGDEILNGGGTQREKAEKLKAWNDENVSMGYYDPTKQNEINNMVRSQLAVADADDLLSVHKYPTKALENMPKGLDSLEESAMVGYLQNRQKGIDANFRSAFEADYIEKAKAEVLEAGDTSYQIANTNDAYDKGLISIEERNATMAKLRIWGRKAASADISAFVNERLDMNGEIGTWLSSEADAAIDDLLKRFAPMAVGSVEMQKNLTEAITKFSSAAMGQDAERDFISNAIKSEFYIMQDASKSGKAGMTNADLLSYLNRKVDENRGLPISEWADKKRSELFESSGIVSGKLDVSTQKDWAATASLDPANDFGDKGEVKKYFENPAKASTLTKARMNAIMSDTEIAYYNWYQKNLGANEAQKKEKYMGLIKSASSIYKYVVTPIETKVFGTEESMAAFQGLIDSGDIDEFYASDMFGNSQSSQSYAQAMGTLRSRWATEIEKGKLYGGVPNDLTVRMVGADAFLYGYKNGRKFVYDQISVGGKLVLREASLDKVEAKDITNRAVLNGLQWTTIKTAPEGTKASTLSSVEPALTGRAAILRDYAAPKGETP